MRIFKYLKAASLTVVLNPKPRRERPEQGDVALFFGLSTGWAKPKTWEIGHLHSTSQVGEHRVLMFGPLVLVVTKPIDPAGSPDTLIDLSVYGVGERYATKERLKQN